MMTMSEPVIALHHVGFAYDASPIFVDTELEVAAGQIVLVGAPAGAGSTVLFDLLIGRRFATGTVTIAGRNLARLRASSLAHLRRRIGAIPQAFDLDDDSTAADQVAVALEVTGVGSRARLATARTALTCVDVPADRRIRSLSMAERQRVLWARALVRKPDILIADQPTSHQDPEGSSRFLAHLTDAASAGAAVVVCTRDPIAIAAATAPHWTALTIHQHRLVDASLVVGPEIDATPLIAAEIERPFVEPAIEGIPNVVPFPRSRSAGHRR
jgi:cell division transport system ATP-binding protein